MRHWHAVRCQNANLITKAVSAAVGKDSFCVSTQRKVDDKTFRGEHAVNSGTPAIRERKIGRKGE